MVRLRCGQTMDADLPGAVTRQAAAVQVDAYNLHMKRLWLVFSQTATVLLAAYFVVATLKPQWLGNWPSQGAAITLIEAPASAGARKPSRR